MSSPSPEPAPPRSCWMKGCMVLAMVVPTIMVGLLIYGLIWRTA